MGPGPPPPTIPPGGGELGQIRGKSGASDPFGRPVRTLPMTQDMTRSYIKVTTPLLEGTAPLPPGEGGGVVE